ncbi:MAG TPA: DUF885 family protein, partial [Pyrinomonadaceae bacterium]|nr:DUF885 family protein [Pyrinomonadaceae bacterium]
MRPRSKTLTLCALAAALVFQSAPAAAQRRAQSMNDAAARSLQRLLEDEWDWAMRENPTFASTLGDRRYNDRLEDVSLENVERRQQHRLETRKRLRAIDRAKLPEADRLNYDLFAKDLDADIEQHRFKLYLLPVNQRGGVQTLDELTELLRFQTVKDYEDWIARMRALPTYVRQTIALMREGVREKVLWPKEVERRVAA